MAKLIVNFRTSTENKAYLAKIALKLGITISELLDFMISERLEMESGSSQQQVNLSEELALLDNDKSGTLYLKYVTTRIAIFNVRKLIEKEFEGKNDLSQRESNLRELIYAAISKYEKQIESIESQAKQRDEKLTG